MRTAAPCHFRATLQYRIDVIARTAISRRPVVYGREVERGETEAGSPEPQPASQQEQ